MDLGLPVELSEPNMAGTYGKLFAEPRFWFKEPPEAPDHG